MVVALWALAVAVLLATVLAVALRQRRARAAARLTFPPEVLARRAELRERLVRLVAGVPDKPVMEVHDLPALAGAAQVEAFLLAGEPRAALAAAEAQLAEAPQSAPAHALLARALLYCDALSPAGQAIARARALGGKEPMLDYVEGRVDHLVFVRRVNPGNPEVQRALVPPLVTPFDRLVIRLARQRHGVPRDAAVWLAAEGRAQESRLDPEAVTELVADYHAATDRCLGLLLAAAEATPDSGERVYHCARLALKLGFVAEGRALMQRLEPLMRDSPERAAYERDLADMNGRVDLPPEPPMPPTPPGAKRSSKLVISK